MAEYRIDELARKAETTVRNVRAYQDSGLLPPPRRDGRVGIYTDVHLVRLRLVSQLLERGYTFSHIKELLSAWEEGRDLAQLFGFEQAVGSPWSDEVPSYATAEELLQLVGKQADPDLLERSVQVGLIEHEGDRFRIPSPRLLNAGLELMKLGIPVDVTFKLYEHMADHVDQIAQLLCEVVKTQLYDGRDADWLPSEEEIPELTDFLQRIRLLARPTVEVLLNRAMERRTSAILGEHIPRALGEADPPERATG